MFQFPGLAPYRWHAFCVPGCPIRKSADLGVFATPRGLSQLVTSFFASESLGIPRTLLLDFLVSSSIVKVFLPPSGVSAMGGISLRLILVGADSSAPLFSPICLVYPTCQISLPGFPRACEQMGVSPASALSSKDRQRQR